DGVKAKREPRAGRTLVGIRGLVIPEIIFAEAPQLLIGRGARARHIGRDARLKTRLHLMAMVITHVCHGVEAAIEHFFGLQCHRAEPVAVAWIVRHLAGDNQLVLRVNSRLHVIADFRATAFAAFHRTTLRVRQRELVLATGEELRLEALIEQLSLLEGLDFCRKSFGLGAAYCALIILRVTAIEFFEISFNTLVNLREELRELILGKVTLFRVDRPELAPIDGDQFRTEEVELLAQQSEGAADLS